jgi:preprotein translocase subunit SecY
MAVNRYWRRLQRLQRAGSAYYIMYFLMVVAFTFFYTNMLFTQQNYGENLKRVGAQIPGVSRGAPTQRYLTRVLSRITLPGAVFLGLIAILPWLIGLTNIFGPQGGSNLLVSIRRFADCGGRRARHVL